MNKSFKSPLAAAVGAAFIAGMSASPMAAADENPFAAEALDGGYKLAADHSEGKCGEGKCGEDKAAKAEKEGQCGGEKADSEGKCGEGKCGADKPAKAEKEGKCGEGKCGGDKAEAKAEKEGKCGEGKCGHE